MDSKLEYIYSMFPNARCELNYDNIFQLLIAVSLSAQTTDAKVNTVTKQLFLKYKTIGELSQAEIADIENILKPLGMQKIKAKNVKGIASIIHNDFKDEVINDEQKLLLLPGVGHKTISVLKAEGFKEIAFPVDTHIHRIAKRLNYINLSDDVNMAEKALKEAIPEQLWIQMHHSLIFFGRYFCSALNPKCDQCKLSAVCKKVYK